MHRERGIDVRHSRQSHDVQRQASPGKHTLVEAVATQPTAPLQMLSGRPAATTAGEDPADAHAAAVRGVATPATGLPYADTIQRLFGRHDISGIQAHTGSEAAAASRDMGASAFATGDHVGFAGAPDLHTAAHEAAHVVQQRAGVHLKGGVGEVGDPHERHADAVADRVVAGQSAEALLDQYRAPGAQVGGTATAQGKPIQRAVKAQQIGATEVVDCNSLASLAKLFALDGAGKLEFATQMATHLWSTRIFPAPYQAQFASNGAVKAEIGELINGLGDLIKASSSPTIISVAANDGRRLADQLFGIIGGSINAEYVKEKCPHYRMLSLGLGGDSATSYLTFVKTKRAKLREYRRLSDQKHGKDRKLTYQIDALETRATELEAMLSEALAQAKETGSIIAKMNDFRDQIAQIEAAIDLDYQAGTPEVAKQLKDLQTNRSEHNKYTVDGGVSDGVDLRDTYETSKACSLFSLLAVVPGFMGAQDAPTLHAILRKTKTLREYDEDAVAARIRFTAGLKPTMQGRPLGEILDEIVQGRTRPSFIADPAGEAHVFSVVWDGETYHPKDNGETASTTDLLDPKKGKSVRARKIASTWTK